MNMKLLSPAGEMDSLRMAVFNGADEVYLGVKDFNARNNIAGFSREDLRKAVIFAHIFGVKVHLTVNILFTDDEMQGALDLIVDAYNMGVDAFIIQDLGLASLIHKFYPSIEIHASTQMGIHNLEGVRLAEKLGFKRVVLSRETPLNEIKRIRENSNIEIEYFVQGALCVSFSGNCYLSSYEHSASGNRGKCKQLCRLPYTLSHDGKDITSGYLLSAKDFNMIDRLEDLEEAGVNAIKIEGRARRPFYVATATKAYRNALDGKRVDERELALAFNRGYTHGYFDGNSNIISKIQGHNGIEIGKVKRVNLGKRFNEIYISTDYPISAKSSLKFFVNYEEVCSISPFDVVKVGDFIKITTTANIPVGAKVNLLTDNRKETEALNIRRKLSINICISACVGKSIQASIEVGGGKILHVEGEQLEEAKLSPLSLDEVRGNFNRNEYFDVHLTANLENVFIPKSKLNAFRRKVFDEIESYYALNDRPLLQKVKIHAPNEIRQLVDYEFVSEPIRSSRANIIINTFDFSEDNIARFVDRFANKKVYLNLPNFVLHEDIEYLRNFVEKFKLGVVVNNVYGLSFDCDKVAGGGLNVYNSYSAEFLNMPVFVAEECGLVADIMKMPYMTLRHCPMKEHLKADCAHCPYAEGYEYRMANGKSMKLRRIKMSSCTFYLTD